ncbi:tetratricopeptide repeat protein [Kribbella sp. NPDC056951]|uniref:tetratricopeptide repeat protein n=1 Tax=Kribbella sp. NPDC056951 TaxID=3345978 RepID=UPI003639C4C4
MDEGVGDPRLTAEGEVSLARLALDDNELSHAADHVASALGAFPTLPEAHEVLGMLVSRPDGGPELWPLDGELYVGTAVARAHALAYQGQYAEALELLVSAQGHEPAMRWADAPWVLDPATPARIEPGDLVSVFARLFRVMPELRQDDVRAAFTPYLALARNMTAAHPESSWLWWAASIYLRRSGEYVEAAAAAERSAQLEPSDRADIALGYALREQGRTDEALAALQHGLTFDPKNLSLYADIAGLLGTAGRLDEAIEWTDRALAIEPGHDCSLVERHGLRYRRDGDVNELVAIADLRRSAEPDSHEAQHADAELTDRSRQTWLGGIAIPTEAVINVLGQFLENHSPGDERPQLSLAVSSIEPPSALLSVEKVAPGSDVTFNEILTPDPRQPAVLDGRPMRQIEVAVWSYDGTTARPAVAPPSEAGAQAVARVADWEWLHLPAAYDRAVLLADTSLDDLLGVLVHPVLPPSDDLAIWPMWIRQLQTWACLGIAHHRTDEAWPDSTRRKVLADLAYGPEDWVTESATLALIATAWADPATREDVAELVGWRFMAAVEAARERPLTILESLAQLVLATPAMNSSAASLARDVLNLQTEAPEPAPAPAPAAKKRRGWFRRG